MPRLQRARICDHAVCLFAVRGDSGQGIGAIVRNQSLRGCSERAAPTSLNVAAAPVWVGEPQAWAHFLRHAVLAESNGGIKSAKLAADIYANRAGGCAAALVAAPTAVPTQRMVHDS